MWWLLYRHRKLISRLILIAIIAIIYVIVVSQMNWDWSLGIKKLIKGSENYVAQPSPYFRGQDYYWRTRQQ